METGREVVIVEAVRTPVGRRGGGLSTIHPVDLLAALQKEVIARAGIDPAAIEQVVGGCVSQVGEQSFNITRTAWLTAGLPVSTPATTVDTQCGSSQQATNVAISLVAAGVIDVALACGVEVMSRIPIGSNSDRKLGLGRAVPKTYFEEHEFTSQFEAAERLADKWEISRADCDAFGLRSQQLARSAWDQDRFGTQVMAVTVPEVDGEGNPTGATRVVSRDEGMRDTSAEGLAALKPVARPDGAHTAGSSSQISDGAGAVLLMTRAKADELGLKARARVVDTCLVGTDPTLMLTGPIDASRRMFERSGLTMADMDVVEINEAFASVVLAWAKELEVDMDKVNPNGGAIALGHPLGGTGAILLTKALHELERSGGRYGLVTMCCGGGLGTGTIIERI